MELIDPNFTIKERILRYICRVLWLTRNCGYGFAYYIFGVTIDGTSMKKVYGKYQYIESNGETRMFEVWVQKDKNFLIAPFTIKSDWVYFNQKLELNWYIGWKINMGLVGQRAMIANRISSRKSKL